MRWRGGTAIATLVGLSVLTGACGASSTPEADPEEDASTDAPDDPAPELIALRERVAEAMDAESIPGWTYAVIVDGEIADVQARGQRCLDEPESITERTFFRFDFVTESITAAAALQAAADPAVGLGVTDDVRDSLDLGLSSPWPEKITLHQLLTYSAGFHTGDVPLMGEHLPPCDDPGGLSIADWVETLSGTEAIYPPGYLQLRDRYSLPTAAHLLATTDGGDRSFAEIVDARVLAPVGMSRAHYEPDPAFLDDPRTATAYACPYRPEPLGIVPGNTRHICEASQPIDGLFIDVLDAARFAQVLARGGIGPDGTRVLSEETVSWMLDWERGIPSWTNDRARRSAGFVLWQTEAGTVAYHHAGYWGYGVAIAIIPEQRFAIVGMNNLRVRGGAYRTFLRPALDVFFGVAVPNLWDPGSRWPTGGSPISDYEGTFTDPLSGGSVSVALEGESLRVESASGGRPYDLFVDAEFSRHLPERFMLSKSSKSLETRAWRGADGNVEALTIRWLDGPLWRDGVRPAPSD